MRVPITPGRHERTRTQPSCGERATTRLRQATSFVLACKTRVPCCVGTFVAAFFLASSTQLHQALYPSVAIRRCCVIRFVCRRIPAEWAKNQVLGVSSITLLSQK